MKDNWIVGIFYFAFFAVLWTMVITYQFWFLPELDNHSMMFGSVVGGIGCSMIKTFKDTFLRKTGEN